MLVVQSIGEPYKLLVPPILPGFFAADEQNCDAARVKCVQDAVGTSPVLDTELAHA